MFYRMDIFFTFRSLLCSRDRFRQPFVLFDIPYKTSNSNSTKNKVFVLNKPGFNFGLFLWFFFFNYYDFFSWSASFPCCLFWCWIPKIKSILGMYWSKFPSIFYGGDIGSKNWLVVFPFRTGQRRQPPDCGFLKNVLKCFSSSL